MYDTADQGSGALRDRSCGHFVGAAIEVPVAPLLRLHGYRDPERIRPQVRDIATTTAQLAGGLIAPQT